MLSMSIRRMISIDERPCWLSAEPFLIAQSSKAPTKAPTAREQRRMAASFALQGLLLLGAQTNKKDSAIY